MTSETSATSNAASRTASHSARHRSNPLTTRSAAILLAIASLLACAPALHAAQPSARPATQPRAAAGAPATLPAAAPTDLGRYEVSQFSFNYNTPAEGQVALNDIGLEPIRLGRVRGGFVAPREGVPAVDMTLAELSSNTARGFYGSAIKHVGETIQIGRASCRGRGEVSVGGVSWH